MLTVASSLREFHRRDGTQRAIGECFNTDKDCEFKKFCEARRPCSVPKNGDSRASIENGGLHTEYVRGI
jgi:hypothetical protein